MRAYEATFSGDGNPVPVQMEGPEKVVDVKNEAQMRPVAAHRLLGGAGTLRFEVENQA